MKCTRTRDTTGNRIFQEESVTLLADPGLSKPSVNSLDMSSPPYASRAMLCTPSDSPPGLSARKLFDHRGGSLTIKNTGVSLYVPPMALSKGREEMIHISMAKQEENLPNLGAEQSILAPVVNFEPNGLRFERPVQIIMPHCAVLDDKKSWEFEGLLLTIFDYVVI